MINLDLIEDNFLKKNAAFYDLSAIISAEGFSFLVVDQKQNVIALRSYSLEKNTDIKTFITNTYRQDDIVKLKFSSVKIAVNNSRHTLVPAVFFDEKYLPVYLERMMVMHASDKTLVDDLQFIAVKNIFAIDNELEQLIAETFAIDKLYHSSTAFIRGAHLLAEKQGGCQMFINVLNRKLNIVMFDNKDLLFNNSFGFSNVRDFVYYVMLVLDQFKKDPEKVQVFLCGQIMRESEIFKLLYRYVKNLNFLDAPDHVKFRSKYEALNAYKFFDLFSLKLCG